MKLANRPSVSSPRMAISAVLALALSTACQPDESYQPNSPDSDTISIGIAVTKNNQLADFCVENLNVDGPAGVQCDSIQLGGADFAPFQVMVGGVTESRTWKDYDIHVFDVAISGFGVENTFYFPDIPEGWSLYSGPGQFDSIDTIQVRIPSEKACHYDSNGNCRITLDPETGIFVLRASGDAVE